jgi:hypothetical protein
LLRNRPDVFWPEQPTRIDAGGTLTLDSIGDGVVLNEAYSTTSLI